MSKSYLRHFMTKNIGMTIKMNKKEEMEQIIDICQYAFKSLAKKKKKKMQGVERTTDKRQISSLHYKLCSFIPGISL